VSAMDQKLQRHIAEGRTISGGPGPDWPEPPIDARGLPGAETAGHAVITPGGPMSAYLGPSIDAAARVGPDMFDFLGPEALARVRAWPVLPLQGAEFRVARSADIAPRLRALLAATLPGVDFWLSEEWGGPFEKYGILHGSFVAPPDSVTGEAMAIEIYGTADPGTCHGSDEWAEAMKTWAKRGGRDDDRPLGVRLPTTVCIAVATYSNVRFPGIGVPLYL
jgi:hypothetical protein